MAANPVLGIDIVARLDQFKAELAKLPDIGGKGARELTAQLSKEIKAAERAARAAAAGADQGKKSFAGFGDAAGTAGASAKKLAGALDLVAPGAGGLARNFDDLADVAEIAGAASKGLGLSLGPVAVIAVTVGAALSALAFVQREAAEAAQKHQENLDKLADAQKAARSSSTSLAKSIADATDRQEVAAGTITEMAAKHREEIRALGDTANAATKAARAEVDAAAAAIKSAKEKGEGTRDLEAALLNARAAQERVNEETKVARAELTTAQAAEVAATKAEEARTAAKKRAADAIRDAAKAEREEAKALAIQQAALEADAAAADTASTTYAAAMAAMQEATNSATESQLEGIAKIEAERAKDIGAVRANLAAVEAVTIAGGSARETAVEESRRAEAAINAKYDAERIAAAKAANDKETEDAKAAAAQRMDIISAGVSAASQLADFWQGLAAEQLAATTSAYEETMSQLGEVEKLLADLAAEDIEASELRGDALVAAYKAGEVAVGDLSDAQKEAIEAALKAEQSRLAAEAKAKKKAAIEAFRVDQAAKILGAVMATAQGVISAFQLGPVAGAIAAAAIAAIGAAQIGIIASQKPSFHAGGVQYRDEGNATVLPGEGVVNRQAMAANGGPRWLDGVNSSNGAATASSMGGVTVLRIGRMEAREVVRTDIASGGYIPQAIRKARRESGTAAGLSGRAPIA